MEIHWPIFVQESGGWVTCHREADEVTSIEMYDVEDKEAAWDSDGQPLSLYWDIPVSKQRRFPEWDSGGTAKVKVIPGPPQPDKLREALLAFARKHNPHEPFKSDETDPCKLFLAAEAHALRNTLSARIARFFRRWRARRKSGTAQDKES